jgi:copper(I)-binding protein
MPIPTLSIQSLTHAPMAPMNAGLTRRRLATLALALLPLAAAPALADEAVAVREPWVRATVAHQHNTGAFMTLAGREAMRLVEARSSAARVTEIHEMAMVGDMMKMRAIAGLDVPAGGQVELKPGGYHVMLIDVKAPIQPGDAVPITLVFEDAKRQRHTVEVKATARAMTAPAMGGGHGQGQ